MFNEENGVPRGIESDGAIMPGTSADGDVHMFAKAFNRLAVKSSTFENGLRRDGGPIQRTPTFIRRILA